MQATEEQKASPSQALHVVDSHTPPVPWIDTLSERLEVLYSGRHKRERDDRRQSHASVI